MHKKTMASIVVQFFIIGAVFIGVVHSADNSDKRKNNTKHIEKNEILWIHDFDKGVQQAIKEKKPIMVDFYADWCGWCHHLDAVPYSNEEVIVLSQDFVCIKVNTDNDRNTPSRYGVRGLPTIVFLNEKGKHIKTVVGYRNTAFFTKVLSSLRDTYSK